MSKGLNSVQIIGNLGADPELKFMQSGDAVVNFRVAVSNSWTKDGEKHEETVWFSCVAWRQLAETIAKYLTKGSRLFASGSIKTRKYQDKDGIEREKWELDVKEVMFLDNKARSEDEEAPTPAAPAPTRQRQPSTPAPATRPSSRPPARAQAQPSDDDLPF